MKLFVKLMIAALVLAVLLPFTLLKDEQGRPLMSIDKLKSPDLSLPRLPQVDKSLKAVTGDGKTDVIYQWRDRDGQLNFTTSPPPDGIEYTAKGYDPNANLIQSIEIKEEAPEPAQTAESQTKKGPALGFPYSPERIEKLFDDAENVQKLLDDRMKQHEAILAE